MEITDLFGTSGVVAIGKGRSSRCAGHVIGSKQDVMRTRIWEENAKKKKTNRHTEEALNKVSEVTQNIRKNKEHRSGKWRQVVDETKFHLGYIKIKNIFHSNKFIHTSTTGSSVLFT